MPKYNFAQPWDVLRDLKDLQRRVRRQELQAGPILVTSYTPTWSTPNNDNALGNGTLVGRYFRTGYIISVCINLTFGSTTDGGSGQWSFALPFDATSLASYAGSAFAYQASGPHTYTGTAVLMSGSATCYVQTGQAAGSWDSSSGNNPFAWTTGDMGVITAMYETSQ